MPTRLSRKSYSRAEAVAVYQKWEVMTVEEIAKVIGRPVSAVIGIYRNLKKAGVPMSPKNTAQGGKGDFYKQFAEDVKIGKITKINS